MGAIQDTVTHSPPADAGLEPAPEAGHAPRAARPARRRTTSKEVEALRTALDDARREADDAREEAASHRDRLLRALADQENFKKRIERTYADLARQQRKDLLQRLLEVFDNLERAVAYDQAHTERTPQPDTRGLAAGLRITYLQFKELLTREGLAEVPAVGQQFDPAVHEAVAVDDASERPEGEIVAELQKGYRYGDELLRPARVKVAAGHARQESRTAA